MDFHSAKIVFLCFNKHAFVRFSREISQISGNFEISGKFRKMSGKFLPRNSGKFSPGFSCIFRGWNLCYSPNFVFLKVKNPENFGKFREKISGKFREIFPENDEKFSPNFSAFF